MKVRPSAAQINTNPDWVGPMLAKLFEDKEWRDSDYGRGWLQAILDNNIQAEGIRAYTPIVSESQINADVPANWPNNTIVPVISEEVIVPPVVDEETGEIVEEGYTIPAEYDEERRRTFAEYTHAIEVTGGYVLRMTATGMGPNRNITNLNTSEFKTWANLGNWTNEFMTKAEVDAITIVVEP